LPKTEYLRTRSFMMGPRFETDCRELIDQYIAAYHKVTANVGELHKYEKDNDVKNTETASSMRSINLL